MRDHETNDDGAEGEEEFLLDRPIEEVFGIPRNYAPENLAPPIDEDKLRAFIARTLHADDADETITLIATFRSWHDAWAELRREIFGDGIGKKRDARDEESLADALGIDAPYASEEFAPPVDRERLREFIADRLPKEDRKEMITLIANFRSWHDALAALLREEIDESQSADRPMED